MISLIEDIEGIEIRENKNTALSLFTGRAFLDAYPFLSFDTEYQDFVIQVGGIEAYNSTIHLVLYGFNLIDEYLVYQIDEYLNSEGYLAIGTITYKVSNGPWVGIGYFYNEKDSSPIIYAKFHDSKGTFDEAYWPLCRGFLSLLKILKEKSYDAQFTMCTDNVSNW